MTWEESLVNGIVDGFCTMQAAANAINDFWSSVAPNPVTNAFSNLGNATYRRVCNREPTPPTSTTPGGQCTGVQYRVTGNAIYLPRTDPSTPTSITLTEQTCPTGIFGPVSTYWKPLGGTFFAVYLRGVDNAGNYAERSVSGLVDVAPSGTLEINGTFIRCDGLPDDCGTPTPDPPPPNYNIINTDIIYVDDNDITVNVPTTIEFRGPLIEVDGTVHIPVRIVYIDPTLGVEVKLDADFNVSTGDIEFNFGGSQGGDDRGGDCNEKPDDYEPIDPPPPPPPDSEADDEPKPDDPTSETVIRGVVVTVSPPVQGPTLIFGGAASPDAYVPDLGLIWFKVRVGGNSVAWFGGIRVQTLRQLIYCEWPGGAIDWGWSPRPGISATITPIRGKIDRPVISP